MHAPTPETPDNRRTRRNVIAMAGILASTVVAATLGATKIARAGGQSWAPSGGGSSSHTSLALLGASCVARKSSPTLARPQLRTFPLGIWSRLFPDNRWPSSASTAGWSSANPVENGRTMCRPSRFVAPRSRQMSLTAISICRRPTLSTSTECSSVSAVW